MTTRAGAITLPPATLHSGQSLNCGQELLSTNQIFRFVMQCDGNAVVYDKGNQHLWASNTNGRGGVKLTLGADGGIRIYNAAHQLVWTAPNSAGHPGATLVMQTDGNAVEYGSTVGFVSRTSATCEPGEVCLYQTGNTSDVVGVYDTRSTTVSDYTKWKFHNGTVINDQVVAIRNLSNVTLCFFKNINFDGQRLCVRPGQSNTNLDDLGHAISSHRPATGLDVVYWLAHRESRRVRTAVVNGVTYTVRIPMSVMLSQSADETAHWGTKGSAPLWTLYHNPAGIGSCDGCVGVHYASEEDGWADYGNRLMGIREGNQQGFVRLLTQHATPLQLLQELERNGWSSGGYGGHGLETLYNNEFWVWDLI